MYASIMHTTLIDLSKMAPATLVLYSALLLSTKAAAAAATPNYADALNKCFLFYEGQRSGKIPSSQRLKWRKDSALKDGQDVGVDLSGGYYDAGDNVKFGFPMAFTATMLAWSIIEFAAEMGRDELAQAEQALRWNTDYLLKATAQLPIRIFVQVGDPYSDHNCWQRPEDMDTLRTTYEVNATHPGSEVAGETAAALAAASIVFRSSSRVYAAELLARAKAAYDFASRYQGSYNSIGAAVCPFYCDFNGYQDELVWGAAWLNRATDSNDYQQSVTHGLRQIEFLQTNLYDREFGWDDKNAGIYILLQRNDFEEVNEYSGAAEAFACSLLPESPTRSVSYTPGGLLYKTEGCNMQDVTALSFLLLVYARHLNTDIRCGGVPFPPWRLIQVAKSQVDYLLGNNPLGMSYMVGYGARFPQNIHHRGSSLPSLDQHPQHIACHDGSSFFALNTPNPNLLIGAVVGGPNDGSDNFNDTRYLPAQTEPTTYVTAPLVGLLAYFSKHG